MFHALDYKTTSTTERRRRRRGFTLTELMVASGIGGMVMAAVGYMIFFSGRSFAALANYVELDNYSRKALDRMTKEIRQANALTSWTTNQLVFSDFDGVPLTYTYSPSDHTLVRTKTNETVTLLVGVDTLSFSIFQRNPVGGTYDQYPTATPATCKLVQLNWTCSRNIFGQRANTESVQSAKIVIRKQ